MSNLQIDQLGQVVELKVLSPERRREGGVCGKCVYYPMTTEVPPPLRCSDFEPVGHDCMNVNRGYWVLAEAKSE